MSAHMKRPKDGQSCSSFFFFFLADNQMRGGSKEEDGRDGEKDRNEGGWTFCVPNETQGSRGCRKKIRKKKQRMKKKYDNTSQSRHESVGHQTEGERNVNIQQSSLSVHTGRRRLERNILRTTYQW